MNTAVEVLGKNYNIIVQVRKPQSAFAKRLGLAFHPQYQYRIYDSKEVCGYGGIPGFCKVLYSEEDAIAEAKEHIKEITQRKFNTANREALEVEKEYGLRTPTLSVTAREVL